MSNNMVSGNPETSNSVETSECFICRNRGHPGTPIIKNRFEKISEDPNTGKVTWRTFDPDGSEHKHKEGATDRGGQGQSTGFGKPQWKRSVYTMGGLFSGTKEEIKVLIDDSKNWNEKGRFSVVGSGYWHPTEGKRMFDILWERKLE